MIDNFLIAVGLILATYGFIGLVGTWLVPVIASSRFYGSGMFTGRMAPTRVNKTIMSLWSMFSGSCLASLFSGHRTLGHVAFLAFSFCAIASLVVRYRHSSK
jgi:hypothetical protein